MTLLQSVSAIGLGVSPVCSIDGVLDVSSADAISPGSLQPRLTTTDDNLLAVILPRTSAITGGGLLAVGVP